MKTGLSLAGLLVRRSVQQHAVSFVCCAVTVALASGLCMAIFSIKDQAAKAFRQSSESFDAVLGARGSAEQLVLNTMFHMDTSTGNLPYKMYAAIKADPRVETAIPTAVGDNYRGYRLVGTTEDFFKIPARKKSGKGEPLFALAEGRVFDPQRREAVVGEFAARRAGLRIGSTFYSYHGLVYDEKAKHPGEFTVTGILKPTGGPNDKAIFIPIESVYRMEGHVLQGDGDMYHPKEGIEIPDEHKEVSAVLLRFKQPQIGFAMDQMINRQGKSATLAWPVPQIMARVFEKMGWTERVLALVAYLVILAAALSIFTVLYQSACARTRDFAIQRSIGAHRATLAAAVAGESLLLSLAGNAAGYGVYAALLALAARAVRNETGVMLQLFEPHPSLWAIPAALTCAALLAAVLPAVRAARTPVAVYLAPVS